MPFFSSSSLLLLVWLPGTTTGWVPLPRHRASSVVLSWAQPPQNNNNNNKTYNLGTGNDAAAAAHWMAPAPVEKPANATKRKDSSKPSNNNNDSTNKSDIANNNNKMNSNNTTPKNTTTLWAKTRRMVARDEASRHLRSALWDEEHFVDDNDDSTVTDTASTSTSTVTTTTTTTTTKTIDLSIPDTVYSSSSGVDLVWDLLRSEAAAQAAREPLLVSFLHSTILHHDTLESSLAFLLANRLQSPAMMISTQLQSLIGSALGDDGRSIRADMMAVRDRDPACHSLPDVFLYFKGFHALQTQRVAHYLWHHGKRTVALFLQSQSSQIFQIDIHPAARLGRGILLDHGTGVVIGSTASVGHNCSILHHVTLGGSGKKGVARHPTVGDGVLLGAGATVLGPVVIGQGCQIGAGTLVIADLPAHCVAVGVPARIIGSFVNVTTEPSLRMNQLMNDELSADGI